jgi:hypothetical protein
MIRSGRGGKTGGLKEYRLGRLLGKAVAIPLLISILPSLGSLLISGTAYATAQPPSNWSFYEYGSSASNLYNLGCNQAKFDNYEHTFSFVILDFGALYDNSGDQVNFSNQVLSASLVAQLAENFAWGYTQCSPNYYVTMAIGTNNSRALNYTQGQAFAHTVNVVASWKNTYAPHVNVWGANDIESWSGGITPMQSYNWYSGYSASGGPSYADYGSADGCPLNLSGSCLYGWGQGDYYNFSWREPLAFPAPEIYVYPTNPVQAEQWHYISEYGSGFDGVIEPLGPLDENDLNGSTDTPTQAWNQMSAYFPSMSYSMEMHNTY